MSSRQALELANERQLDLVKIAPQAKPPVCRIMDYGKFRFEQSKKEKEARKNQKIINIKEIRFSPTIEDHDLNFKAKNAQKFLQDGDKVKVTIRFRGREVDHVAFGEKALGRFYDIVKEDCVVEKPAKLEGKNMTMVLAPKQ
jgi:translation initiation factor IF-3